MDFVKPFIEKEDAAPGCLAAAVSVAAAAAPESAVLSPAELTGLVGWACSDSRQGWAFSMPRQRFA